MPPEKFIQYLTNQHAAYSAVERLIEAHLNDEWCSDIPISSLFRADAFRADLTYWTEYFDLPEPEVGDETRAYLEALNEKIKTGHPEGLVAVIYLRYTGLLRGRFLETSVTEWINLNCPGREVEVHEGMAVYKFPEEVEADRNAYHAQFRAAINSAPLTPEQKAYCIEICPQFFELSTDMLDALWA